MTFADLGLRDELLRAVTTLGFEEPMPIQAEAIPHLLKGERDMVGLAQTGTGKTGAFGLPLLHLIDPGQGHVQGIIVCPTRELCLQIVDDLEKFAAHLPYVKVLAVYGGAGIQPQMRALKKGGVHIIVATPGRLCDLIRRRTADLSRVSYAVLDEADEMLNMGFQEDIESIFSELPTERKVWLFSATMGKGVARIADRLLDDPVEVTIGTRNSTATNLTHSVYSVLEKNRYPAIKRLLDNAPNMLGLIFCRTRRETQQIAEKLMGDNYRADALHGDLSQAQRDYVMRKFRQGSISILVATDVAARGIDVDDITHVIHYRLPDDPAIYNHRSGRTGRAGRDGKSLALINGKEKRRIRDIENTLNIKFDVAKIPDGREICEKQLFALVDKVVKTEVNHAEIDEYLPKVNELFAEMSKEELIQHFLSVEFNRFLDYYRDSGDINHSGRDRYDRDDRGERGDRNDRGAKRERRQRRDDSNFKTFFINIGTLDNAGVGALVRLICDETGIDAKALGHIKLNREFSFFDVEETVSDQVRSGMQGARFDGREVVVNDSKRSSRESGGGGGGGGYKKRGDNFRGSDRRGGGERRGGYGNDRRGGGGGGGYNRDRGERKSYGRNDRDGDRRGGYGSQGGDRDRGDSRDRNDRYDKRPASDGDRDRSRDRDRGAWVQKSGDRNERSDRPDRSDRDRKPSYSEGGGGGGSWRDRKDRDSGSSSSSGGGSWRDRKDRDSGGSSSRSDSSSGGSSWRERKNRDSSSGGGSSSSSGGSSWRERKDHDGGGGSSDSPAPTKPGSWRDRAAPKFPTKKKRPGSI